MILLDPIVEVCVLSQFARIWPEHFCPQLLESFWIDCFCSNGDESRGADMRRGKRFREEASGLLTRLLWSSPDHVLVGCQSRTEQRLSPGWCKSLQICTLQRGVRKIRAYLLETFEEQSQVKVIHGRLRLSVPVSQVDCAVGVFSLPGEISREALHRLLSSSLNIARPYLSLQVTWHRRMS